nr:MAG TPA: hypothetical protein [Caudoviricetes sp.]
MRLRSLSFVFRVIYKLYYEKEETVKSTLKLNFSRLKVSDVQDVCKTNQVFLFLFVLILSVIERNCYEYFK